MHEIARGAGSTNQFDDDVHFRVGNSRRGIGHDRQTVSAIRLFGIANDDVPDFQSQARALVEQFALVEKNGSNTTTHDAASKERDSDVSISHRPRLRRKQQRLPATSAE